MRHRFKVFLYHALVLVAIESGFFFIQAVDAVVIPFEEPVARLALLLQTVLFAILLVKDLEVTAITMLVAIARAVGDIYAVLQELVLDGTVSDKTLAHTAIECARVTYGKHLNTLMKDVNEHVSPSLLKLAQVLLRHRCPILLHYTQD